MLRPKLSWIGLLSAFGRWVGFVIRQFRESAGSGVLPGSKDRRHLYRADQTVGVCMFEFAMTQDEGTFAWVSSRGPEDHDFNSELISVLTLSPYDNVATMANERRARDSLRQPL